jgi:hypothetical protein
MTGMYDSERTHSSVYERCGDIRHIVLSIHEAATLETW